MHKPVTISGDASSKGLGVVLLQDGHPVAYGSRALTETQKRYAQIEREMLAIVYGCEKFHHYIYGRKVTVETDHKPLVAIYNKPLYRATPRLQRMLMKLQRYELKLVYVPGKDMHISDALSRSYLQETPEILVDDEIDVDSIEAQLPVSPAKLQQLKEATAADETLQTLKNTVLIGWPVDRSSVPLNILQYWNYRDEITAIDGILYKGQRLMVPISLKKEMLNKLHEAHMGIVKTQTRARELLFWPKMNQDIEDFIGQCAVCNKYRNSNCKEPLISQEMPSRPWSKVAADMFQFKGSEYLLCVDYYSKFPEIVRMSSTTSAQTITCFKSLFARHGIPTELFTDNGPQFSSYAFKKFATEWDFIHTTSSPRYPQSNGQAERCVQTVKNLLRKADESGGDIYTSLMNYRASPIDGIGLSPSQLLMNRQLRTKLPITADLLNSKAVESCKPQLIARQEKQKYYYDRHSATLPNVNKGEIVRVQKDSKQWEPAIVDQKLADRSYVVRTGDNQLYRRNRRQLLKTRETTLPSDVSDHSEAMYDAPPQSHSEPDPPNTTPAKPNPHENAATPHREPRPQQTLRRPKHLEDFICK